MPSLLDKVTHDALALAPRERARLARQLLESPDTGFLADRFPYAVFYLEQPESIWIVPEAHYRRKPDYWIKRMG